MANQKIGDLAAATSLLSTDNLILSRSGSNLKISGAHSKSISLTILSTGQLVLISSHSPLMVQVEHQIISSLAAIGSSTVELIFLLRMLAIHLLLLPIQPFITSA